MDESDPATWPDRDDVTPPRCPRCGGVHVDVHEVAWRDEDDEEERR